MFHELSESQNKDFQHSHAHLFMYFPLLHCDSVAVLVWQNWVVVI